MGPQADIVHSLAAHAAEVRRGALPSSTLAKVKLHAFDSLGAICAGAQTAEGRASHAPFLRAAGGHAAPLSPALAAALLSTSCRLTECDDIHLLSSTTPGSVVYSTALAATGLTAVTSAKAGQAVVAGYGVMATLGLAANGAEAVYRDTWPTYLAAAMTSATVTAMLIDLSEDRIATALAIAATMTTGLSGRIADEPTSRWVTLGCAVQNGMTAALSAEAGLRGDPAILERLSQSFSPGRLRVQSLAPASQAIEATALKPYCTGRQSLSAIEAFMALCKAERIEPRSIERIVVTVPPQYRAMIDRSGRPRSKLASRGVRYQLALAAFHPDDLYDVDRQNLRTADPAVCQLMDIVEVQESAGFGELYPAAWPATVAVRVGGRTLEMTVVHPSGDPERPLLFPSIADKFRSISQHCRTSIPVDELAAAAQELDFRRAVTLLSRCGEAWRETRAI